MTVRTLKDCRLVIVIFSSSCVKKGGSRGDGWGGGSALAGRGHPLLVDSSSHMAAAAGSQDSWWEQDRERKDGDIWFRLLEVPPHCVDSLSGRELPSCCPKSVLRFTEYDGLGIHLNWKWHSSQNPYSDIVTFSFLFLTGGMFALYASILDLETHVVDLQYCTYCSCYSNNQ